MCFFPSLQQVSCSLSKADCRSRWEKQDLAYQIWETPKAPNPSLPTTNQYTMSSASSQDMFCQTSRSTHQDVRWIGGQQLSFLRHHLHQQSTSCLQKCKGFEKKKQPLWYLKINRVHYSSSQQIPCLGTDSTIHSQRLHGLWKDFAQGFKNSKDLAVWTQLGVMLIWRNLSSSQLMFTKCHIYKYECANCCN